MPQLLADVNSLPMTPGEIRAMHRQAKKPDEQVKILAQLNNTHVSVIEDILAGREVSEPEQTGYVVWSDAERELLALYCARSFGWDKIAEKMGRSKQSVIHMSRRLGLKREKKGAKDTSSVALPVAEKAAPEVISTPKVCATPEVISTPVTNVKKELPSFSEEVKAARMREARAKEARKREAGEGKVRAKTAGEHDKCGGIFGAARDMLSQLCVSVSALDGEACAIMVKCENGKITGEAIIGNAKITVEKRQEGGTKEKNE